MRGVERKVRLTTTGSRGRVELNDHDVSSGVAGGTLRFAAGELPVLTLDLYALDGLIQLDRAQVLVSERCTELLVSLGWTPPTDLVAAVEGYCKPDGCTCPGPICARDFATDLRTGFHS